MHSLPLLTTISLLSLPLSILAVPLPQTDFVPAPGSLYILTAGSISLTPDVSMRDFSLTIQGVEDGNVGIECTGQVMVPRTADSDSNGQDPSSVSPATPVGEALPSKLACPADPNGTVFVTHGGGLNFKLTVQWP
ncbi:MAG: hypothetical protein Q9174_007073, partial [Haloplaca sp. 1 TL-2023]